MQIQRLGLFVFVQLCDEYGNGDECKFFTYYADNFYCYLFEDCTVTNDCTSCIVGDMDCYNPGPGSGDSE